MCSRCLSNSGSCLYVLKRIIVLLLWFWIGFLFVFIKACSHDATGIIRFLFTLKPKKWFMNQWIWKELRTSQNKILSVLQSITTRTGSANVGSIFFKVHIHWALNKFSIELNRNLVQSSVNWFYYCTVKSYCSQRILSTIWLTTTRLCKACGRLVLQMQLVEFSGEARF